MDPRTPAFVLCVCAIVILVAIFTKSWATAGKGIGLGPSGVEVCFGFGAACHDMPWRGLSGDIAVFATFALISGIAAAIACAGFGGLFLATRQDKLPQVKLGKYALVTSAVAMTVFEIRVLAAGHDLSWGVFPALASVVTGIVMLRKLAPHLRVERPIAMAIAPPIPQPAPVAASAETRSCPRCGTRLAYISEKQQWFCVREQEYV
ncbi:MAG: hypothetical protein JWO36_958 [Myxococcales bacterium]|nr:hypothetical protein [Myxococcales bacterium]